MSLESRKEHPMKIPHPKEILQEIRGRKEQRLEAIQVSEERLHYALARRNFKEWPLSSVISLQMT